MDPAQEADKKDGIRGLKKVRDQGLETRAVPEGGRVYRTCREQNWGCDAERGSTEHWRNAVVIAEVEKTEGAPSSAI